MDHRTLGAAIIWFLRALRDEEKGEAERLKYIGQPSKRFPATSRGISRQPLVCYEVNGAMRGVLVPQGTPTLTMLYPP